MAHCSNCVTALSLIDNRPLVVSTGVSCNITMIHMVSVMSVYCCNRVAYSNRPPSQHSMTNAIDLLEIYRLFSLSSSSDWVLSHFRRNYLNLIGPQWSLPCLFKLLPAPLVDQTSTCHLLIPSSRFAVRAIQPHIIIGESPLALPLNWLLRQEKSDRLALLAGWRTYCTHPFCL